MRWETVVVRGVPARVFQPDEPQRNWLVWAHGGSWSHGSVDGWHEPCADLARLSGSTVVSVEYRLAPRHPHPAALRDVLTIVDWVATRTDQVCVGGDSAGGTIAACAALTWRDLGRRLVAQLLAYPPLDPRCQAASYRVGTFPTRAHLLTAWRRYRGLGNHGGYATPLDAGGVTGVAPALLAVGTLDPVVDDVRDYGERLRVAGNTVALQEFPTLAHGAFLQPGESPMRRWLASGLRDLTAIREAS